MAMGKLTTADLMAEIKRREKGAGRLRKRREAILSELEGIERELAALGMLDERPARGRAGGGGGGKRPRNSVSLNEALASCAEVGAEVSPAEAAELVKKNGYQTVSKTFGAQVANALAKHPKFKKQGRGLYKRVK